MKYNLGKYNLGSVLIATAGATWKILVFLHRFWSSQPQPLVQLKEPELLLRPQVDYKKLRPQLWPRFRKLPALGLVPLGSLWWASCTSLSCVFHSSQLLFPFFSFHWVVSLMSGTYLTFSNIAVVTCHPWLVAWWHPSPPSWYWHPWWITPYDI